MSELLVSRQGPLAHVWLASNYDKKLSKQQFLSTNIVSSSNLISTRQLQPASDAGADTITLRLSGQLLLGIVRIYSRKTKYLLDDIQETLYKLKNSFKMASGASLGSSVTSTVNLPPQRTTISNMARITLQDQVTDHDLFYQDDLVLDEPATDITRDALLSQVSVRDAEEPDRSLEFPRAATDMPDIDLDLDFDLNLDNSIEQGRDAVPALPDAEQSLLDIDPKPMDQPDMSFDLGEPLETLSEQQNADTEGPHEAQTPPEANQRERRALVGITDSGVIKTTKRKLVVDSPEDLERGLPNEVLRNIQNFQTTGRFADESLTLRLSLQEKLELIQELAAPVSSKRRKIWNLDDQLRQRCLDLSNEEPEQDTTMDQSADFDLDTNIDFDLSLPELEPERTPEPEQPSENFEDHVDSTNENPQSTMQVAEHLRNAFYEQPHIYLGDLMAKDTEGLHAKPLGTVSTTSTSVKVSERREATKCFFELLVLASNDCVTLEQNEPLDPTQIPSDVVVRPRDNLVSMYLA